MSWLKSLLGFGIEASKKKILNGTTNFTKEALEYPFIEENETRSIFDIGDYFDRIQKSKTENNYEEVVYVCKDAISIQRDYVGFYLHLIDALDNLKRFDEAKNAVQEALKNSRSKIPLCEKMAEMSIAGDDPLEPVKWWIRSCVPRVYNDEHCPSPQPYLRLSYLANSLREKNAADRLKDISATTMHGHVDLNSRGRKQQGNLAQRLHKSGNALIGKESIVALVRLYDAETNL